MNIELTKRELDVLKLFHLPDKEIAKKLGVGVATVNSHRNNLKVKLYARNKAEAIVIALKNGIIKLDDLESED